MSNRRFEYIDVCVQAFRGEITASTASQVKCFGAGFGWIETCGGSRSEPGLQFPWSQVKRIRRQHFRLSYISFTRLQTGGMIVFSLRQAFCGRFTGEMAHAYKRV